MKAIDVALLGLMVGAAVLRAAGAALDAVAESALERLEALPAGRQPSQTTWPEEEVSA